MGQLSLCWEPEHATAPVQVSTVEQLRKLVVDLRAGTQPGDAVLVQVFISDSPWKAEFFAGFDGDKGVAWYSGADTPTPVTSHSGEPGNDQPVTYYLDTTDQEFPANSEVPADAVEAVLVEFFETNGDRLPTSIAWQPIA
ncbi:Imm1 family immunity protein [Amycolatopsis sp. YIM 10]|uniref:Imm1 family immunity protein n=1 Tax=Amycolatopsis sp. YIM 10 TaxID=2653857 RepID=UPI0012907B63|nr:Imm1 family immunity protein [Amycolatopsis sp. YIM 10]QFU93055.1 hypothetical protein YIM_39560 [Amycolatopsis sp. YIM 10]